MAQITATIADKVIDNGHYRMNWNTGKLELCQVCPDLPKGTIIHAYGAFMSYTRWAMTGEGRECVKLSENVADSYFSSPFHTLDEHAEPIAKKFGIGFYYDLDAEPATDEEIAAAIERGRAFLQEEEERKAEAARAWEEGVAAVRAQYAGQFEEKPAGGYTDAVHVARNVRKDLARNFPGVKFSVRTEGRYSQINIEWTDGPTEEEVKAVADKHQEVCERDRWNEDIWDHRATHFTAVFGGVQYLWYRREISPERRNAKKAEILAVCPDCKGDGFYYATIDQDKGADALFAMGDIQGLTWINADSVARVILAGTSFYQAPAPKPERKSKGKTRGKAQARAIAGAGLQLVDYSDKAVAVTGDTKPHAEALKRLGGRFNARLSCGPGWIFSKGKEGALREALGLSAE